MCFQICPNCIEVSGIAVLNLETFCKVSNRNWRKTSNTHKKVMDLVSFVLFSLSLQCLRAAFSWYMLLKALPSDWSAFEMKFSIFLWTVFECCSNINFIITLNENEMKHEIISFLCYHCGRFPVSSPDWSIDERELFLENCQLYVVDAEVPFAYLLKYELPRSECLSVLNDLLELTVWTNLTLTH